MDFLGVGLGPILVILVLVFVLFGPSKIPETARNIGKYTRAIRKMSSEITEAVSKEMELDQATKSGPDVNFQTEHGVPNVKAGPVNMKAGPVLREPTPALSHVGRSTAAGPGDPTA